MNIMFVNNFYSFFNFDLTYNCLVFSNYFIFNIFLQYRVAASFFLEFYMLKGPLFFKFLLNTVDLDFVYGGVHLTHTQVEDFRLYRSSSTESLKFNFYTPFYYKV